jgi:hypothetical protein
MGGWKHNRGDCEYIVKQKKRYDVKKIC